MYNYGFTICLDGVVLDTTGAQKPSLSVVTNKTHIFCSGWALGLAVFNVKTNLHLVDAAESRTAIHHLLTQSSHMTTTPPTLMITEQSHDHDPTHLNDYTEQSHDHLTPPTLIHVS